LVSKYSEYFEHQIVDDTYKQIAEQILLLVPEGRYKQQLIGILYEGGTGNFSVNLSGIDCVPRHKDSPELEAERRLNFAYLFARNPEAMQVVMQENSILFHGTKSQVLPSILKYGLNSVNESNKNGIDVTTGEEWSRRGGKRAFVSLTNCIEIALEYAAGRGKDNEFNSFGIMLGMNPEDLKDMETISVFSDISEVGVLNNIPIEYIKTLTVPKEKVQFVEKLIGDIPINVIGMDMEDPFYIMPMGEKLNYLMNSRHERLNTNKEYTKDDLQNMTKKMKLSKIFNLFNFRENFSNEKNGGNRYESMSR